MNANLKINSRFDNTQAILFKNIPAEWKSMPTGCLFVVNLLAGEESVKLNGYEVQYLYQAYAGGLKIITVNGEHTTLNPTTMSSGEYRLSDGARTVLLDSLNQAYAGGVHSAEVCLIK